MSVLDQLSQAWNDLITFMSQFVIPDWGALVGLLPIFLLVGVIGPLLTLAVLAWFVYLVRRPATKVTRIEGAYPAPLGADGRPVYPTGEPYCARDALVHPSGATLCERCQEELVVTCPKCLLGRQARITTCANCGLVLRIDRGAETRALRPVGPPPGGAAAA